MQKEYKANKGFTQYVQAFIGLMIVCIIAVSVAIPTVVTAISNAAIEDEATATVVGIVPLMIAVAVLMLVVSVIR